MFRCSIINGRNYLGRLDVYISRKCIMHVSFHTTSYSTLKFLPETRAFHPQHPRHRSSCIYRTHCEAVTYLPTTQIIRAWFLETRPRTCAPYVTVYGETGTSRNRRGGSFNGVIVPLSRNRRDSRY